MTPPRRRGGGALAVTLDQIVCSASNFALMLLAIRALEVREVGTFALGFTILILAVVAVRALVCEPLLIGYSTVAAPARRAATAAAGGAVLLLAAGIGVPIGVAGALLGGAVGGLLLASAVALPALLLQDVCRFHFLAADRAWAAVGHDVACLLVTLGAALALLDADAGPATPLLCWGLGALAAATLGLIASAVRPHPNGSVRYLREQRTLGIPLAGAVLVGQGAGRLSLGLIALTCGVAGLGLYTTAATILTPANTLITAAGSFALAEAARRQAIGRAELRRFLARLSAGLAVVVVITTAAAVLLFGSLVAAVFGEIPTAVRPLLWPAGLWALGTAISTGALAGLRVLTGARGILRGTAALGAAQVLATAVGGTLAGIAGACWAAAAVALLGALHWWRACLAADPPTPRGAAPILPEPRRDGASAIATKGMS